MHKSVGIVGLGRMGMPAAKVLINAGYRVVGYEKRSEAVDEFIALGGESVSDYKTVAEKVKIIIVFVLNDAQVIDVISGESGLLKSAAKGHHIICMATINRQNLERLAAQCAAKKVGFVDSPCTGGPARAESGTLTLITAAADDALKTCRPILELLGNIVLVGKTPGMGQAVKHCNQLLVAVTHTAVMELILMARKTGLDARQTCDIIASGVAGSDYFRLVADSVLNGSPAPCSLGLLIKDSNIVMGSARDLKLPLLTANAANQYFLSSDALGLEEEESSELMCILEKLSGGN
jgi:3-hydroxyisobutyrate dehydrogenase